jgi:hypothetical protein
VRDCSLAYLATPPSTLPRPGVEVDPHDHPPEGGAADLLESSVLDDMTDPHVQLGML